VEKDSRFALFKERQGGGISGLTCVSGAQNRKFITFQEGTQESQTRGPLEEHKLIAIKSKKRVWGGGTYIEKGKGGVYFNGLWAQGALLYKNSKRKGGDRGLSSA